MDLFGKLGDIRKKMDEIKSRLDTIYIDEQSSDGKIKITVTANRKVKEINIVEAIQTMEKDELQELLETVINRALERAETVSENEMRAAGKDLLPGFPGLF